MKFLKILALVFWGISYKAVFADQVIDQPTDAEATQAYKNGNWVKDFPDQANDEVRTGSCVQTGGPGILCNSTVKSVNDDRWLPQRFVFHRGADGKWIGEPTSNVDETPPINFIHIYHSKLHDSGASGATP